METIRKVRVLHRGGLSKRGISRKLGLSRNTVKKFIAQEVIGGPEYPKRVAQPYPQLGAYLEDLRRLLYENSKARRQRTVRALYGELCGLGFTGSYSAVCRYARHWRGEQEGRGSGQAFIPLVFAPGEAYQFDWSSDEVLLGGELVKVKVAHFILCYSRTRFIRVYPNETQEMVLDAHVQALAYFGGVPRRGIYDNMKTAVKKVLRGKTREWSPAFERLCAHYRIEPVACTPASGWEKGRVESQVKFSRQHFFTPLPEAEHLEALNAMLLAGLEAHHQSHAHPDRRSRSVAEIYAEERAHLATLPVGYQGVRCVDVRVSSTCLAMVDRNSYSVVCKHAGQIVQCHVYAGKLVFLCDGEVIGEHARRFGRGGSYSHSNEESYILHWIK